MDLHSKNAYRRAISPVSIADNTAVVSQIIDRTGFVGLEFVIASGSLADADATFTTKLEHGNDPALADATVVEPDDLIGAVADASFDAATDDDQVKKIGYIGICRYVRLTITPASNAGAAVFSAIAHLAGARKSPVA